MLVLEISTMKRKKVFVISINGRSKGHWIDLLSLEKACAFFWTDYQMALTNLTTVWPDVIIIEGDTENEVYQYCIDYALKVKCGSPIFAITQEEGKPSHHNRLHSGGISTLYLQNIYSEIHLS